MAVTDYNKLKKLDVDSVSGTPTIDKATPILIRGNDFTGFDGFESGSSQLGWESNSNFSIDNNSEVYGTSSLQLDLQSGGVIVEKNLGTDIDFSANPNKITQASIKIDNQTGDSLDTVQLRFKDQIGTGGTIASIRLGGDGSIDYLSSAGNSFGIGTWSAGEIYDFRFEFDASNNEVEIFQNDDSLGIFSTENTSQISYIDIEGEATEPFNVFFDRLTYTNDPAQTTNAGGNITIDWTNVSSESDIAVYDQNDNLLGYEIESFDATSETAVLWCYDSWVRDGSTQAKVVYGDGPSSSEEGSATDIWGNTGQNAVLVQHLNGNAIDSSTNGEDGTITGTTDVSGYLDGGLNFDGTDDQVEFNFSTSNPLNLGGDSFTIVSVLNPNTAIDDKRIWQQEPSSNKNVGPFHLFRESNGIKIQTGFKNSSGNFQVLNGLSPIDNEIQHIYGRFDDSASTISNFLNGSSTSASTSVTGTPQDTARARIANDFGAADGLSDRNQYEFRIYDEAKSDDWIQADFDASPKAGQTFFTQQAAESTQLSISPPVNQVTASNPAPTPTGTGTVDVAPGVNQLTADSLSLQVDPQVATVSPPVNQLTADSLNPAVTTSLLINPPVNQVTASNPDPAPTGTGQTQVQTVTNTLTTDSLNPAVDPQVATVSPPVNQLQADSINPAAVTTTLVIRPATNQLTASNPDPTPTGTGQTEVQTVTNTLTTDSLNPDVEPGTASIQTETNQLTTDSVLPAVDATGTAQIQTVVNNLVADSIEPALTGTGTITVQTETNQLTADSLNPAVDPQVASISPPVNQLTADSLSPQVLLFIDLEFKAPTKAIIKKPNRYVSMQSRTFKANDLGDELQATLKDQDGALDLSEGVKSVTLLIQDTKGEKVLDKQVSFTDAANGEIEYNWQTDDTPIQNPGAYEAEFEILDTRDNAETVPNDGSVTLEIEDDING